MKGNCMERVICMVDCRDMKGNCMECVICMVD